MELEMILREVEGIIRPILAPYSFFISGDYYSQLFERYFSVGGFIIGFVYLLILFFAINDEKDKKKKKTGFIKIVLWVAVINSCGVLMNYLNVSLDQSQWFMESAPPFSTPDNIISGFVMSLVIASCYRTYRSGAFFFGMATHITLAFFQFNLFSSMEALQIVFVVVRVLLAGILCVILSRRKYFYTSWIWYFGFHLLTRTLVLLLPLVSRAIVQMPLDGLYTVDMVFTYYSQFALDAVIFAGILVFSIVFERGVLTVEPEPEETAA